MYLSYRMGTLLYGFTDFPSKHGFYADFLIMIILRLLQREETVVWEERTSNAAIGVGGGGGVGAGPRVSVDKTLC
jgi:hypothetical protein